MTIFSKSTFKKYVFKWIRWGSFGFFIILGSNAVSAVPPWVRMATQNIALEQMVAWMLHAEYYKIRKIVPEEMPGSPNPDTMRVRFVFNDHLGCKDRLVTADCYPLTNAELFCSVRLTHCSNNNDIVLFQGKYVLGLP